MSEEQREILSALVDGALPPSRTQGAVDVVNDDGDLRALWGRYHLIGDVLRGTAGGPVGADLSARLARAIETEPVPFAPRARRRRVSRRVAGPLAGLAVAASLAMVAVFTLRPEPTPIAPAAPVAATAPATVATQVADAAPEREVTRLKWRELPPQQSRRLNGYLVQHTERAAGSMRGVLPYARVVGYQRSD